MKKLTYFLSLAAMMLLGSCSSDTEDFVAESSNGKTIAVNVVNPDGTRFNSENLELMAWEKDDPLYAVINGGEIEMLKLQSFNGGEAVFSAPTQQGNTYRFFYSGAGYTATSVQEIDYLGQVQTDFSSANVKNYILLQSDEYTSLPTGKIQLKNLSKIMKIKVNKLPAELENASMTYVSLSLGGKVVAKTQLMPALATGNENVIYMAFDYPTMSNTLEVGKEIAVLFKKGGTTYKAKAACKNERVYQPGKIYTLAISDTSTPDNLALVWEKNEKPTEASYAIKIKFKEGYTPEATLGDTGIFAAKLKKAGDADDNGFVPYNVELGLMGGSETIIPNSLKDNLNVIEVIIPANITGIGVDAFNGCTNLQKVNIAAGSLMNEIFDSSFSGCTSLTSINLNEGLEKIGSNAFQNCTGLTSITLPSTLNGCKAEILKGTSITNVIIKCPYNDIMAKSFNKLFGTGILEAPAGCAIHVDASWNGKTFNDGKADVQCVEGNKFCGVLYSSLDNTIQ